jgi:hypothetical protein
MNIENAEFDADSENVAKVAKKFLLKSYDCERVPTNDVVFHLLPLYAKALGPLTFSGYNFCNFFNRFVITQNQILRFLVPMLVFFGAKFDKGAMSGAFFQILLLYS